MLLAKMKPNSIIRLVHVLLEFISGSCIPCEVFVDIRSTRHLNTPGVIPFGPKRDENGTLRQYEGSRSIIWIVNAFN